MGRLVDESMDLKEKINLMALANVIDMRKQNMWKEKVLEKQ